MKRFRLMAWHTKTRVPNDPPDFVAEFNARSMWEEVDSDDGYVRKMLSAVTVQGDPVEVRIVEVEP